MTTSKTVQDLLQRIAEVRSPFISTDEVEPYLLELVELIKENEQLREKSRQLDRRLYDSQKEREGLIRVNTDRHIKSQKQDNEHILFSSRLRMAEEENKKLKAELGK